MSSALAGIETIGKESRKSDRKIIRVILVASGENKLNLDIS